MPYNIDPNLEQQAIRKGYGTSVQSYAGGGQRRGLTQAIDVANLNAQPSLVQNLAAPGNPSDGNANASWHTRRELFEKQQELMRQKMAEEYEKKNPTTKVQDHVPVIPRNYQGAIADNTVGAQGANYVPVTQANQEKIKEVFGILFDNEEFTTLYERLSVVENMIVIDVDSDAPIRIRNANHPFVNHCVQHYSRLFPNEVFPLTPEMFFSSLLTSLFKDVSTNDFLEKLKSRELEKNVSSDDFISGLKDSPASQSVTSTSIMTKQSTDFSQLPDLASKVSESYTPPVPKTSSYSTYSHDVDLTALDQEHQLPLPQPTPTLVPVNPNGIAVNPDSSPVTSTTSVSNGKKNSKTLIGKKTKKLMRRKN